MAKATLRDVAQFNTNLDRMLKGYVANQLAPALKQVMTEEMEEAKARTPVKTGHLRDSHEVTEPEVHANTIKCTIINTAEYAAEVHENLEAFHENGEAKWLERTIMEARPHLGARIAELAPLKKTE